MRANLTKNYSWDGLTTVQLKKKRKNTEIENVLAWSRPLNNWQRSARINEILKNSIQKDTLESFSLQYTVNTDTSFSQVDFRKLLQYDNPAAHALLLNSHNKWHSQMIELFRKKSILFCNYHSVRFVIQSDYIRCLGFSKPSCCLVSGEIFYIRGKQVWFSFFVFDRNPKSKLWRKLNKHSFGYIDFPIIYAINSGIL